MNLFTIIIVLVIGLVAFRHYVEGFFSATISAILCVFSAVLAFSLHEPIVESVLRGHFANSAHALVFLILFAVIYTVLRQIFDKSVPGNIRVPAMADKVGGAIMGVVAGLFAAGVLAVAAQQLPFTPSVAGYSRYETQSSEVSIPGSRTGSRSQVSYLEDEMTERDFKPEMVRKLFVPADDLLVGLVSHLSNDGSLSAGRPLEQTHPNYLQELFGQRVGIEPGAKRVAMNTGGLTSVTVDGVWEVGMIGTVVDHEFKNVRGGKFMEKGEPEKARNKSEMLIIVRTTFDRPAAEAGGMVRLSPGSVRLVARGEDELGQPAWVNYYPIGTMHPMGPNTGQSVLVANKVDDFLFLNLNEAKGVDWVFRVRRDGLVEGGGAAAAKTIIDGAFLEVKRMARVDLSGQTVKSGAPPQSMDYRLLRKQIELEPGRMKLNPEKTGDPNSGQQAPTPPTPPTGTQAGGGGQSGDPEQRLIGTWQKSEGGATSTYVFDRETWRFESGGETLNGTWQVVSSSGDTLELRGVNNRQSGGPEPITMNLTFKEDGTLDVMRRHSLSGQSSDLTGLTKAGAGAAQPTTAEQTPAPPDPVTALRDRLVGTWDDTSTGSKGFYTFNADSTFVADLGTKKGEGTWEVVRVQGNDTAVVVLTPQNGKAGAEVPWRFTGPDTVERGARTKTTFRRRAASGAAPADANLGPVTEVSARTGPGRRRRYAGVTASAVAGTPRGEENVRQILLSRSVRLAS